MCFEYPNKASFFLCFGNIGFWCVSENAPLRDRRSCSAVKPPKPLLEEMVEKIKFPLPRLRQETLEDQPRG